MEEKIDRIEKNLADLTEIVVAIKDYMVTNMATKDELAEVRRELREEFTTKMDDIHEKLDGKIQGLQRSIDGNYERQSALESRVTRIETELHI